MAHRASVGLPSRPIQYPGHFYKLRAAIPAAEAFRSLKDGGYPLINR